MTRWVIAGLALFVGTAASADWRERVLQLAQAGDISEAVAYAEAHRAPWMSARLAAGLPPVTSYLGWVAWRDHYVVYRTHPKIQLRVLVRSPRVRRAASAVSEAVATGLHPATTDLELLRAAWFAPVADWLDEAQSWTVALDAELQAVPLTLLRATFWIHASTQRSAALARARVSRARARPPTLFAYARADPDDPGRLPNAHAEIVLAAAALAAPATLLAGKGALEELQIAAHDGRLTEARFVLFAAHAAPDPDDPGQLALQLAPGPRGQYRALDTLHLQFNAELVVLSACESARAPRAPIVPTGFFQAALFAGVGHTLLTSWRVDDAASAQFVAALFTELGAGATVATALGSVQTAFKAGEHGERYRAPYFWAGWQLWGG